MDNKSAVPFFFCPLQRIKHPQTVKFHWEIVLSTSATCLLDFRQRIMESCWNAISASQTSEGLLALPNMGNKGISMIRHLHTRHQGVMSHVEQTKLFEVEQRGQCLLAHPIPQIRWTLLLKVLFCPFTDRCERM